MRGSLRPANIGRTAAAYISGDDGLIWRTRSATAIEPEALAGSDTITVTERHFLVFHLMTLLVADWQVDVEHQKVGAPGEYVRVCLAGGL